MGIHDGVVRSRAQRGGDSYPGEAQNSDCEDREKAHDSLTHEGLRSELLLEPSLSLCPLKNHLGKR